MKTKTENTLLCAGFVVFAVIILTGTITWMIQLFSGKF